MPLNEIDNALASIGHLASTLAQHRQVIEQQQAVIQQQQARIAELEKAAPPAPIDA